MKLWLTHPNPTNRRRRLGLIVCATLLLAVALAFTDGTALYADEGDPPGADPCASCHSPETDAWLDSAHAVEAGDVAGTTGAACAACHGDYSRGHPDDGAMEVLTVDSAICQECHPATFDQWQHSIHAGEGVQCIGCHQVHSQELRLTDEQLCRACHKESLTDSLHSAHWYVDAACTDCHMSPPLPGTLAMAGLTGDMAAPLHDFTSVAADTCLECHRKDVENPGERLDVQQLALVELRGEQQKTAELDARLQAAKQTSRTFQILTPVSLGFGIGVGGVLGIIFMLALARYSRKDGQK